MLSLLRVKVQKNLQRSKEVEATSVLEHSLNGTGEAEQDALPSVR